MQTSLCVGILIFAVIGSTHAKLDLPDLLQTATDIAGALGTKNSGEFSRGNGCMIKWSYEGMLMGLKWKYMGVCTDLCTHEVETVFYESRGGTVEHCLQNLLNKVHRHGEL